MPLHLKPCFLFLGIFAEDTEINVSNLTKLWIAEGFVRANGAETLEMVAYKYLLELVGRNLILAKAVGSQGNIKTCGTHDLVRDLCIRQADEERFSFTWKYGYVIQQPLNLFHPVAIWKEEHLSQPQACDTVNSALLARSYSSNIDVPEEYISRLLRVFDVASCDIQSLVAISERINLRLIACSGFYCEQEKLPSSIYCLWNLQSLILTGVHLFKEVDIWKMHLEDASTKASQMHTVLSPRSSEWARGQPRCS